MNAFEKGKEEYETGRWSKAYKLFRQAASERDSVEEVRILMARCLLAMGDPVRAEQELRDVKEILSERDQELLIEFEKAWKSLEDTKLLDANELRHRRESAGAAADDPADSPETPSADD